MNPADDHGPDDLYGGSGRTRTRLPGAYDDDLDGTPRRPARPSRSLITVVGIVVLLIAAIAFANQGGGEGGSEGGGGAAGAKGTSPTAPTGAAPVKGRTDGIPTGYARNAQGAQSAAANYAVVLGSDGMFRTDSRRRIVETLYAPGVVESLLSTMSKAYSPQFFGTVGLKEDGTAPEGLTFVSRTVPVGTKVTEQKGDTMTVEVWSTGLIGLAGPNSTKPVTSSWFTLTQKLTWADGDWKIASTSQREGPTPINGDNRASSAEEIAGAVAGYGGFTHAR
ncbi:hypothetical protein [Streptomyces tsukubensis]|uniref:hypothetical protein n=1 Tax=Streptomyces tsukubensis TaxID=83656 RepID=UPI00344BE799